MADRIVGHLYVSANDRGEIVVDIPREVVADFSTEEGGHIVFSPHQARGLARLLLKHVAIIERQN